jgi:hypothetical protein
MKAAGIGWFQRQDSCELCCIVATVYWGIWRLIGLGQSAAVCIESCRGLQVARGQWVLSYDMLCV